MCRVRRAEVHAGEATAQRPKGSGDDVAQLAPERLDVRAFGGEGADGDADHPAAVELGGGEPGGAGGVEALDPGEGVVVKRGGGKMERFVAESDRYAPGPASMFITSRVITSF